MDENLINLDDLQGALEELKNVKYDQLNSGQNNEEMEASQKRYEEYIKKNTN